MYQCYSIPLLTVNHINTYALANSNYEDNPKFSYLTFSACFDIMIIRFDLCFKSSVMQVKWLISYFLTMAVMDYRNECGLKKAY